MTKFLICIDNQRHAASLEVRKLYERRAAQPQDAGLVRVVDESGEDYLYPAEKFIAIDLPAEVSYVIRRAC